MSDVPPSGTVSVDEPAPTLEPPTVEPPTLEPPTVEPPPLEPPPPPSPWRDAPIASPVWRIGGLVLDGILGICTVGVGWLAWWILGWDHGRSPAKSILHTRVVLAESRELPPFGRMARREAVGKGIAGLAGVAGIYLLGGGSVIARFMIAASVAWLAMSGVAALLDDRRRALWDVLAGTLVVLDPEVTAPAVTSAAVPPLEEEGSEPT